MEYDLFISYAIQDNLPAQEGALGFISALVEELKRAHLNAPNTQLSIFVDKEGIRVGDDWELKIDSSLRKSKLLITCLSPNYFKSNWCKKEWIAFTRHLADRAIAGEGIFPIYCSTVVDFDSENKDEGILDWVNDLKKRSHIDLREWFTNGSAAFQNEEVQKKIADLDLQITSRLESITRAIDPPGMISRPSNIFVGRQNELRTLRHILTGTGTVGVITAVQGFGGIGKTALANQYAYEYAGEYVGGRWMIRCEGIENIPEAMLQLVTPLKIELNNIEKKDSFLAFERIILALKDRTLQFLSEKIPNPASLLILDNVDKPNILSTSQVALFPKSEWLHILVTTRLSPDQLFKKNFDRIFLDLNELNEKESLLLIEQYQPDRKFTSDQEHEAALKIVHRLGGFTLAVETIAIYLGLHSEVSCSDFLDRLNIEGIDAQDAILKENNVRGYIVHREKSLFVVLQPILDGLTKEERFVSELASLFPPDRIPLPWLKELAEKEFSNLKESRKGYPDQWEQVEHGICGIKLLQKSSILDERGHSFIMRMHRLIQETIHKSFTFNQDELLAKLYDLCNDRSDKLLKLWYDQNYQWEIDVLIEIVQKGLNSNNQQVISLLINMCEWFNQYDDGKVAERLLTDAKNILEKSGITSTQQYVLVLSDLGHAFCNQDRWNDALPLFYNAIEVEEKLEGDHSHGRIVRLLNLGAALHKTGNILEAEKTLRKSVELGEQTENLSPYILGSAINNLGALLNENGKYKEAERIHRKGLKIDEEYYGSEHPVVANDLFNIASLLDKTNRKPESETLLRRALRIQEKALPEDHPNILSSLKLLADVLDDKGLNEEARQIRIRHVDLMASKDDASLYTLRELAVEYLNLSQYVKAEELLQRILNVGFEVPGTLCNIARTCFLTDRFKEAQVHVDQAWLLRTEAPPYVVARILWFKIALSCLYGDSMQSYISQLKAIMRTDNAYKSWIMKPVLDILKPKIIKKQHSLLSAIVNTFNNRRNLKNLNKFKEWVD